MNDKKLFLVCTETSGDLLGAKLVQAMKKGGKPLRVMGVGGTLLEKQGMELIYHISDFNVRGMVEVLSQLSRLRAQFAHLKQSVEVQKPDAIVLVDAPDFNMRFAKAIRHLKIPIIYYVSPQVWAWRKKRARTLANLVDHLMVLFQFEEPIYRQLGLPVTWVGHPLVDEARSVTKQSSFFEENELDPNRPVVVLAPGSRKAEVRRLLPIMAEVARACQEPWQFAMACADTVNPGDAADLLAGAPVTVIQRPMRQILAHARAAVVASGTATLETSLMKVPMIVGYKMNPVSYLIAKTLVRLPHVAMVNIVLKSEIVPELIQRRFRASTVMTHLKKIMPSGPERQKMIDEYNRIPQLLGNGGSSERAAEVVWRYLSP